MTKINFLNWFQKGYIDFFNVGISSYLSRAIGLLISVILARWLGPESFGIYSLGYFLMITIISNGFAGIDQTFIYLTNKRTDISENIETNYIFLKVFIAIVIIAIVFVLYLFSKHTDFVSIKNIDIIMIALIGGLGNVLFSLIIINYQAKQKFFKYSKVQIVFSLLNLAFVLAGVVLRIKTIGFFLLIYNVSGIIIIYFYKDITFKYKEIKRAILKEFLIVGKWLILYNLLRVLNYRIDFFILSRYTTNENLGMYSAALRVSNLLLLLTGVFAIILLPKATKIKTKKELREFWNIYKKITFLLVTISSIVLIISPYIISMIYGSKYMESTNIFKILLIANLPVILQLPFKNLFISFDNSHYLFLLTLLETIIIFLFSILAIRSIGILAPPVSKLIAYSISLIGYIVVYNLRKPQINNK